MNSKDIIEKAKEIARQQLQSAILITAYEVCAAVLLPLTGKERKAVAKALRKEGLL